MNTVTGNDPMLSGIMRDDWSKLSMDAAYPLPSLSLASGAFTIPVEGLLSPEPNTDLNDMGSLWSCEQRQASPITSIKLEPDDGVEDENEGMLCSTSCSDPGDMGLDDLDNGSSAAADSHSELDEAEFNEDNRSITNSVDSYEAVSPAGPTNFLQLSEREARKLVEEQFERIAFLPSASLTQREKISFILAQSDCKDFTVEEVLNFDKRKSDSARACAKIVQNIPQRYRWECVQPEDIPCCYTIVADCKKVSKDDKAPRPMNAFMIWAQGARRLINVLCPKMQNALISEALGYYWRQKSEAFKQRFEQEKVKLRRFHNVEFPEYKYKPKTKVQKAKEKQELSLSKAIQRATLKRERSQLRKAQQQSAEDNRLYKRRGSTKCGRPRKTKAAPVAEVKPKDTLTLNSSLHCQPRTRVPGHQEAIQMSPTKPEIKDMLTLKILNDRLTKETSYGSTVAVAPTLPRCDMPCTGMGVYGQQLSPLDIDQPAMGDILDDLTDLESLIPELSGSDNMQGSSSVFDTPANTPPADGEEEHHQLLSPSQLCVKQEPGQLPVKQEPTQLGIKQEPTQLCTKQEPAFIKQEPASPPSTLSYPYTSPPSMPSAPINIFPAARGHPVKLNASVSVPSPATSSSSSASSSSTSRAQILMPSLSAMLASPAKSSPYSGISATGAAGRTHFTLTTAKPVTVKRCGGFSNILNVQWVGKNTFKPSPNKASPKLTFPKVATSFYTTVDPCTNATTLPLINKLISGKAVYSNKRPVLAETKDTNNNFSSVINNNNNINISNTSALACGAPPSYASSVMNLKLISAVADSSDLDSLSLDLNVPLLSEDVMRTYIDTL